MLNEIRAFFAIELPDNIKEALGGYITVLKKHTPRHSVHWVKPENLHITLQFLKTVKEEDVSLILDKVKEELKDQSVFKLMMGDLELFPTHYRPHVISLQIEPHDTLATLAESIGRGITRCQYPVEARPFRGHLTLGRIMKYNALSSTEGIHTPDFKKVVIQEVVFFKSELKKGGSVYSKLGSIQLL